MRAQHRRAAQIRTLGIGSQLDGLRVVVQRLSASSQLIVKGGAQQEVSRRMRESFWMACSTSASGSAALPLEDNAEARIA